MSDTAQQVLPLPAAGAFDRLLRDRVVSQLARLRTGALALQDPWDSLTLGEDTGRSPPPRLRVNDARFYRAVALGGSVGAAEAYMDGAWQCDDLVGLVRLLVRNRDLLDDVERGPARIAGGVLRAAHALRRNTASGARRNIAAHYDLGNTFFRLFLSEDLMYSSALFERDDDTLETASTRKLEAICRKLQLREGDRVLEIGTGWGGFALHAAREHGCHVTTTTLSREQYELARQRVAEAGLQERVTVLQRDFRELDGTYDKLVSIEMVEAIGPENLRRYFECIGERLSANGLALIQAITIEDHRYEQAVRSVDFIKRHVFPGSFIPSIAAMLSAKTAASDLALLHLEDMGLSYARTLQAWRERFLDRLPQVRALGFDERFIRMWEFYLAYCEGGFRERSIGVAQMLFARPGYRPDAERAGTPEA
ncbi:SAM-dependent methyltransferase [Lysobacter auxotrophicus]|uniref:Cyclopropane-fatty-acyl-phospholipid synthase family protein n=1 Tax=Lysobacter auxotrophicus TaxID=2992573 RepID=A0ABN6UJY1_9GAMM|nr:cyclopropane-fatty-acyl-phospholipid synthase family protein [Lysobacter auxotrophicus]BDU16612.1 cyclopropane-fatty-acyl-phospholipid synthase family protein [Lysobacter auxotrophicus]